jgi:putative heme iron utilization protein
MSVQFFNAAGDAMFKIFVRRDAARELIPDQVAKFEALRTRYA